MRKKHGYIIVGVLVLSVMICSSGFAQDDIQVSSDYTLKYKSTLSGLAKSQAEAQFNAVIAHLISIRDNSSNPLDPQHQEWINQMITMVEERKTQLDTIEIYIANEPDGSLGDAFDDARTYFEGIGYTLKLLQDVDTKQQKADQKSQSLTGDDLETAIMGLDTGVLPLSDDARNDLKQFIEDGLDDGTLQVATGSLETNGSKKRISIATIYLIPDEDPANTGLYVAKKGTAVVIATDQ